MTEDKALKRAVRAHMQKTGEAYTIARHFLLDDQLLKNVVEPGTERPAVEAPLPLRAADPGMSDEAVAKSTGRDWDGWFRVPGAWRAQERTHAEIAKYVATEHGMSGWWAQSVTVGYERARGMRERNEHIDGYSVTVGKTFGVPVDRFYRACADVSIRELWLNPERIRERTFTENKVWRCEMTADKSKVEVRFTAKSSEKTSIALEHAKLTTAEGVDAMRAFWKERFSELDSFLS